MNSIHKHLRFLSILSTLLGLATLVLGVLWILNPEGNYEPWTVVLGAITALIGGPTLLEWVHSSQPRAHKGFATRTEATQQQPIDAEPKRLFRVPNKPVGVPFIGRKGDLEKLVKLFEDSQHRGIPPPPQLIAVRGMLGVGKTRLALEIAHDDHITEAFPDGVLWTDVGANVDAVVITSKLVDLGKAVGADHLARKALRKEVVAELNDLFRGKQMLLIFDDVWKPEHAAVFGQVVPSHGALLVTSRQPATVEQFRPRDIHELRVLDVSDAINVISYWAEDVVTQHRASCETLVRNLGCLPVSLNIAGRLLGRKSRTRPVQELLSELCANTAPLLDEPLPADLTDIEQVTIQKLGSLVQKSIERLGERTRSCLAELGHVCRKNPEFNLELMWVALGVDQEGARLIAQELVDFGLLDPVGEEKFRMHPLLADYAERLP